MLFLVMGFISLADEIKFMLISCFHVRIRPILFYSFFLDETPKAATFHFSSGFGQGKGPGNEDGFGQPHKRDLPTDLPAGLRLIGANLQTGTHHAVLCCQSSIAKGRRFGPYQGDVVDPAELASGQDNVFLWEVGHNRLTV